ncbi:MAG: hypothetical protein ABIQ93_12340 [Saprospiraceae bacterium]
MAIFSDKLISLLQTLLRADLVRLRKFLCSPYFNDREEIIQLFDWLYAALRKEEPRLGALTKEKVWKALYPKQALDDAQLRRLASDLTQLVLQFLVQENWRQDPLSEALEMQKILEKPELKKHLAGVERRLQKLLEEDPAGSTTAYLSQFKMHRNAFYRASNVDDLGPADFYLECFYITQKLRFYVALLLYRGSRATEQEMKMIPGFWEYILDERFAKIPLIQVYLNVIACFNEPDEEQHFQDLMQNLDRFASALNKKDLRENYHVAQNYCALKINQGKKEYYRAVFDIFKKIIEQDMLLDDGLLSEGMYKNIITSSLGVGEYDWAEQFIQGYSSFLPAPIRDNARSFNLAYLYFHLKKYEEVINLLQNVEYSDVIYALGAKSILLRTYYESDETVALDSLIDSFRIYLRRNKIISKNQKREYNSFLNIVKKLTSIPLGDQTAIAKLRQRVTETSSTMPKKWLLEKMDELQRF